MPGRDQAECLQQLPFFQLNETEHAALAEFNRLYKAALVADMARLIGRHQPAKEHLRHYLRIKIEGEQYPAYQTARWQLKYPGFQARPGLFQWPHHTQLRALTLDLPPCIAELEAYSLIRLAFAPQGKYFYHYLTHCINDTVRLRANRSHQPLAAFYSELNQMDRDPLHALLQQKQGTWPAPYARLAAIMVSKLHLTENDLACTDGKPLDFIASHFVFNLLKKDKKATWSEKTEFKLQACSWTPADYAQLSFAARHGCYRAALTITQLFDQKIEGSHSPSEALTHYQEYYQQWCPIFSQQYQAAGILLLVNTQKVLAHSVEDPQGHLVQQIYQTYVLALEQEASHKNALRLALGCDHCQPFVAELHARVDSPTPITTIDGALDHLHFVFPQLSTEFAAIDSRSPTRSGQRRQQSERFALN